MLTVAVVAYLASSVLYGANLFTKSRCPAVLATVLAGAGIIPHTLSLFAMVGQTGRAPYSTVFGATVFTAWVVVLMQIGLTCWRQVDAAGAFSVPIALILLLYALVLPPEMWELLPDLRRQSLAAHISVTLLAYGAFTVAFGLAVLYLMENRLLKAKQLEGILRRLPPLVSAEELAARFATFGQAMLTLGLAIGSVWAMQDWQGGLWQDPKVVPSLVTWAVYTAYLGLRWVGGWRGRAGAYLLVVGFVSVLFTFVGINWLYPGMHGLSQQPLG